MTKLIRTRPLILVTTLHPDGTVNAGTFGAYTNLSASEVGLAIGKPSHTYQNIKRTGELVINVLTKPIARAGQVCSQNIPPTESELDQAGLSTEPAQKVSVPLVRECVANLECKFSKEVEIGYHSLVIVACLAGHLEESVVDKDGGLDVVKAEVAFAIRYPEPLYAVLSSPFRVD